MKKVKCLGAFDDDGHRRPEPILHLGPVTKTNLDLPSNHNPTDYVNNEGYYYDDIIRYKTLTTNLSSLD